MKHKNVTTMNNCPLCGVSWIGNPIPDDLKKENGNRSHFSRLVQVLDWKSKRITGHECPDCGEEFRLER